MPFVEAANHHLLKTGEFIGELWHIRRDGSIFPSMMHNSLLRDDAGIPIGMLSTLHDITDSKKAEEKLIKSEARYRALFECAAEGIVIIENHTGKFKYANPAFCQMLRYSEYELKDMTAKDIHTDEMLKYVITEIEAHRRDGKSVTQHDIEFVRKDGTNLYADVVTTPDILIDGTSCGAAFFIDITKRKVAEDEKKKLEAQLWQSQKMEAVGRLSGGIAHDFNNILTVIIANAEMALMGGGKEDLQKGLIEAIKDAGGRAAILIRQLLAFSRRQVFQAEVFNLNDVVFEMNKMLKRLIGEDIELKTYLSPEPEMIETDRGQVEQIIMNLAVNAKDAMPGGGKITIETAGVVLDEEYIHSHVPMKPGRYEMLVISDTGTGMTEEVKSHIFEPFFTTKEKGKGTGLGLAIVYGIVKQSNGYIWVYSEPGKGTSFKIYFPSVDKPAGSIEKTKKEVQESIGGSETILVVEDDGMIREIIKKILNKSGYRILSAADSKEAIHISEEHEEKIALMLTDVVLPGMGGRELADLLVEKRPDMKVLYMSGYTDDAIVHHGILEKGLFFMQKPFTSNVLKEKIREVLDGR
jgi:two-component system, cell cycle sensor histidine kinase and response regulator CckA